MTFFRRRFLSVIFICGFFLSPKAALQEDPFSSPHRSTVSEIRTRIQTMATEINRITGQRSQLH